MKQLFLAATFVFAVVLTTAARPAGNENPRVEKAFNQIFTGATHVNWTEVENGLLKASFVWADRQTVAIFDQQARLIGTIRGLFFREVPLSVTRSVSQHFSNPVVLEVNEIVNEEGVRYSLIVEDRQAKYDISIDSLGYILDKSKRKK
ncbi:MAG: hypothetical protein EOO02_18580 [Chitinophagaceae bacterium]|nr:MAG: hypothetical protein EOO02_18580 [Chitinophagaceae bacterium]